MRKSIIEIEVTLDADNVPEKLAWKAEDGFKNEPQDAKAMALALWDEKQKGTVKIDLWTKDMEVHEMKRFFIETLSGMADTIRNATQDEVMAMDMENLAKDLGKRLEKELRSMPKM
jgi:gliding motility-associated protein GldC